VWDVDVAALDRRVEHTSRAHREEERLVIVPRFQLRRRPNLVQRAPPLPSMVCESVKGGKSLAQPRASAASLRLDVAKG
jgi:hypothetical protein